MAPFLHGASGRCSRGEPRHATAEPARRRVTGKVDGALASVGPRYRGARAAPRRQSRERKTGRSGGWAARGLDAEARVLVAPPAEGWNGVRHAFRCGRSGSPICLDEREMPEVARAAVVPRVLGVEVVPMPDDARGRERRRQQQSCRDRRCPLQRQHHVHYRPKCGVPPSRAGRQPPPRPVMPRPSEPLAGNRLNSPRNRVVACSRCGNAESQTKPIHSRWASTCGSRLGIGYVGAKRTLDRLDAATRRPSSARTSVRPTAWTWSCRRASPGASRRPSIEPAVTATMNVLLDTNVVSELMRKTLGPTACWSPSTVGCQVRCEIARPRACLLACVSGSVPAVSSDVAGPVVPTPVIIKQ